MKNKTLGFLTLIALATITVIKVDAGQDSVSNLMLANVEALAADESSTTNCEMTELSKTNGIIVINNARNKGSIPGIAAGCKKKCDETCTVKEFPDINL